MSLTEDQIEFLATTGFIPEEGKVYDVFWKQGSSFADITFNAQLLSNCISTHETLIGFRSIVVLEREDPESPVDLGGNEGYEAGTGE